MSSITQIKRYLPHELKTRIYAVQLYRHEEDISFVCRRYKISKASLMRWNKKYDGTPESLMDKSHRPHTQHPKAHTEEEQTWICNLHRRNPHISVGEMYGKLKMHKGYQRHPGSLYRVLIRLGLRPSRTDTKTASRKPQPYHTPQQPGVKWQMDVKYVPSACYVGSTPQAFFQYTVIDEASRERYIHPYEEVSSASTCDFLLRAITFFGYQPQTIQTDNGPEFAHTCKTERVHPLDALCEKLGIRHKRIRPRTPRHNGKVERSHRNDQERFYNNLKFFSLDDLKEQMRRYLHRSNRIPTKVLGWKSPFEKRKELLQEYPVVKAKRITVDAMTFIYGSPAS